VEYGTQLKCTCTGSIHIICNCSACYYFR